MAQPAPQIALVMNDRDYVLAACHDDGFGDAIVTVSKDDPNAFDILRDGLKAAGHEVGQTGLIFLPYESFAYKKLRRKDIEANGLEAEFADYLGGSAEDYLIDYGEPTKGGTHTPVAISKSDLEDAKKIALNAGITPIGLSTVFPTKLRSPQPFFRIETQNLAPRTPFAWRKAAPLIAASIFVAALGTVTYALWSGLLSLDALSNQDEAIAPVQIANLDTGLDPRLLNMVRPPQSLGDYSIPAYGTPDALQPRQQVEFGLIAYPFEPSVLVYSYERPVLPTPKDSEDTILEIEADEGLALELDANQDDATSDETVESAELFEFEVQTPTEDQVRPVMRPLSMVPLPVFVPDADTIRPVRRPGILVFNAIERTQSGTSVYQTSIPVKRPPSIGFTPPPANVEGGAEAIATTTSESAEDAATTRGRTLNKNELSLIGVFGKANAREAMFRTASGRFVTKSLGESVSTWKIVAISADKVQLSKGNRTQTLVLPD